MDKIQRNLNNKVLKDNAYYQKSLKRYEHGINYYQMCKVDMNK